MNSKCKNVLQAVCDHNLQKVSWYNVVMGGVGLSRKPNFASIVH